MTLPHAKTQNSLIEFVAGHKARSYFHRCTSRPDPCPLSKLHFWRQLAPLVRTLIVGDHHAHEI